jgi:hypothetical protein
MRNGSEQGEQGGADIADKVIAEGRDDGAPSFVLLRIFAREAVGDDVHSGLGLGHGDARAQSGGY